MGNESSIGHVTVSPKLEKPVSSLVSSALLLKPQDVSIPTETPERYPSDVKPNCDDCDRYIRLPSLSDSQPGVAICGRYGAEAPAQVFENSTQQNHNRHGLKVSHSFGAFGRCRNGQPSSASTIAANPALLGPWHPPGRFPEEQQHQSSTLHVRGEVASSQQGCQTIDEDEERTPRLVGAGSDTSHSSIGVADRSDNTDTAVFAPTLPLPVRKPSKELALNIQPIPRCGVQLIPDSRLFQGASIQGASMREATERLQHGHFHNPHVRQRPGRLSSASIPNAITMPSNVSLRESASSLQKLQVSTDSAEKTHAPDQQLATSRASGSLVRNTANMKLKRSRLRSTSAGRIEIFLKPVPKGYAVKSYRNGDRYEGELVRGKRDGYGLMFMANGEVYAGQWFQDARNGRGLQFYSPWGRYEGDFRGDARCGWGMLVMRRHGTFFGQFYNSRKHGRGILIHPRGEVYAEWWNHGKLVKRVWLQDLLFQSKKHQQCFPAPASSVSSAESQPISLRASQSNVSETGIPIFPPFNKSSPPALTAAPSPPKTTSPIQIPSPRNNNTVVGIPATAAYPTPLRPIAEIETGTTGASETTTNSAIEVTGNSTPTKSGGSGGSKFSKLESNKHDSNNMARMSAFDSVVSTAASSMLQTPLYAPSGFTSNAFSGPPAGNNTTNCGECGNGSEGNSRRCFCQMCSARMGTTMSAFVGAVGRRSDHACLEKGNNGRQRLLLPSIENRYPRKRHGSDSDLPSFQEHRRSSTSSESTVPLAELERVSNSRSASKLVIERRRFYSERWSLQGGREWTRQWTRARTVSGSRHPRSTPHESLDDLLRCSSDDEIAARNHLLSIRVKRDVPSPPKGSELAPRPTQNASNNANEPIPDTDKAASQPRCVEVNPNIRQNAATRRPSMSGPITQSQPHDSCAFIELHPSYHRNQEEPNQDIKSQISISPTVIETRRLSSPVSSSCSSSSSAEEGLPELSRWAVPDVVKFLSCLGLPHLGPVFQRNQIGGEELINLTEDDLENELRIRDATHRQLLVQGAQALSRCEFKRRFQGQPWVIVLRYLRDLFRECLISASALRRCRLVGEGGFGLVYRGLWGGDAEVAIKAFRVSAFTAVPPQRPPLLPPKAVEVTGQGPSTASNKSQQHSPESATTSQRTDRPLSAAAQRRKQHEDRVAERRRQRLALMLLDLAEEAKVLMSLRHPNVTRFWGVCLDTERQWLVTQFVPGGSLFSLIHSSRGVLLDTERITRISLGICSGMAYVHSKGLLHCDLKSPNILLDENLEPKICDFGLALRTLDCPTAATRGRIGTPQWMAAEILRGAEYSKAADVYSFGVMMWEMLSRRVPHNNLTLNQVMAAVGWGNHSLDPVYHCPDSLSRIMKSCLNRIGSQRPTFEQLVEEFTTLLESGELENNSSRLLSKPFRKFKESTKRTLHSMEGFIFGPPL